LSAADFLSGRVPLAAQTPSVIAHDYKSPRTVQASFGMQQQIGDGIGFDSDLTYYRGMNLGINRDINLFYDPNTGYNVPPQLGRPRPDFGPITWYESTAKADYFALASSFTRRYRKNWQAGLTYTLVFFQHDMGTGQSGYSGALNNVFCIACEWATSPDFQRHTFRANGIYKAPWGVTLAASYFFGSGSRFASFYAASPFGTGTNRLVVGPPITIPASVADRFDGPATLATGTLVPRDSLKGLPLSKLDLRATKEVSVPGTRVKLTGVAELFNVFNHANYGGYNAQVNSATFGQPVQTLANSYLPRAAQFAFKVSF
jgi:hypothetical protein